MGTDPKAAGVSHLIGIGGIGMSGLALVLAAQGQRVSGSDLCPGGQTGRLEEAGITIYYGHRAENLQAATRIIYSSAIRPDNPEMLAASTAGIPVLHRAELLAEIAEGYRMIGVSGTHGKTTTSSMIAVMLTSAGLDPTVVVGGEVDELGGNARLGLGPHLVAEVDESDGSLVLFTPEVAVVTNIEGDHLDHYRSVERLVEAFAQYTHQSRMVIGCLDCPLLRDHLAIDVSYSLEGYPNADYSILEAEFHLLGSRALVIERGEALGELCLRVPGRHNLSNALAAVAVGRYLGLSFEQIAAGLAEFRGARRRFQIMGERDGILFVDDYAHHPSEIRATLAAARLQNRRRVVAVFQPHRYSRSHLLLSEFATAFADADTVVATGIYAAGEPDTGLVSGEQMAEAIAAHHLQVYYEPSLKDVSAFLSTFLKSGDLALFLGAGNLNQTIPELLEPPLSSAVAL